MKKTCISIFVCLGLAMIFSTCTKLDETLYDRISADDFYKTPEELNAGLTNVYYRLNSYHIWWQHWQLQECTTDHGMCPWGDGDIFKMQELHTWAASGMYAISDIYNGAYSCIATANNFLDLIGTSNPAATAEIRAIRAYCYLELIDLFGNVPIITVPKLSAENLPAKNTRSEVFAFIESELKAAITDLPSVKTIDYPRVGKETAQAMLAKLYLNAEVWTGTAQWQQCVDACDAVINSSAYSLPTGYGDIWKAFDANNADAANRMEIILGLSKDHVNGWDPATGNWTNVLGLHGQLQGAWRDGKSMDITQGNWGGPSVQEEHYEIYDLADFRRSLILKGEFYDKDGNLLIDIQPYSNTDIYAFNNPLEGLSCIKYKPDPNQTNPFASNDLILLRYADILLSKAEALYRLSTGNVAAAEALITQVYSRNFVGGKTFTINSLDDILMERSREFLWECSYRTDLIRFGKFTTFMDQWRLASDPASPDRTIFPIPQSELDKNPNLTQNGGYN